MASALENALRSAECYKTSVNNRYVEASTDVQQKRLGLQQLESRREALLGIIRFSEPYRSPEVNDQICEIDVALIELRPALQNALDVTAALKKQLRDAEVAEAEAWTEYEADLARVLREQKKRREAEEFRKKTIEYYSSLTDFPAPPPLSAGKKHALSCKDKDKPRPIEACSCAVRAAFLGGNLVQQCSFWTPSNFQYCSEEVRDDFVCKAEYVYNIMMDLHAKAMKPGARR